MAQKYYNTQDAAKVLNISVDDVKKMLERRELHGYRDGADWKFKAEEIEALAKQSQSGSSDSSNDDEGGDVLLSEVALGQSGVGTSGTVIAMNGLNAGISDIQLAGSQIDIGGADAEETPVPKKKDNVDAKVSQFEELDLTLDEDLTLEDSTGKLPGKAAIDATGGSAIDLGGKELEDDDLVLGGSGKGSDVTIGSDSGISLVDPADSGLSLEQPLDLAGAGEESLELGEDDMLPVEAGGSGSNQLKTDDEFLLTPLEDSSDGEDSESGSQVIALDTGGDDSAGMMGDAAGGMAAMLDEDISSQPALGLGMAEPMPGAPLLAPQSGALSDGVPMMQAASSAFEAPYSGWQIAGLASCAVLLMLCGMMMYDNMRNMWSWDGAYTINSSIMDLVVGLFEGK
jgi:excisionase family DNA binding protein